MIVEKIERKIAEKGRAFQAEEVGIFRITGIT